MLVYTLVFCWNMPKYIEICYASHLNMEPTKVPFLKLFSGNITDSTIKNNGFLIFYYTTVKFQYYKNNITDFYFFYIILLKHMNTCVYVKNSCQYHQIYMYCSCSVRSWRTVTQWFCIGSYVINACVLINRFKYTRIDIDFSVWIDNREYNHMYIENKANSKRKLWQAIDENSSLQ